MVRGRAPQAVREAEVRAAEPPATTTTCSRACSRNSEKSRYFHISYYK